MKALLDCGHVIDAPDCCTLGNITACLECGERKNREIVDIWDPTEENWDLTPEEESERQRLRKENERRRELGLIPDDYCGDSP